MFSVKRYLADLILLSITIIWGITFVLIQNAITIFPPFAFMAIRFGCASLILLPFIFGKYAFRPATFHIRKTDLFHGCVLGILLFLGYGLQTFSLLYTTPGKSGFLTGLSVALVPLFSFFVLRQRPSLSAIGGIVLACIGLYLLSFIHLNAINHGDIYALLCAIAFGLQLVYTGKYTRNSATEILVIVQFITVTILSMIATVLFEPWKDIAHLHVILQPEILIAIFITAVFATALAYLAQTQIQEFTTPTHVALIFAAEPIFAALADYFANHHVLGVPAFFGCVLIFCGMLLSELKFSFQKKTAPDTAL
ncbi:MAG TPA: DMT family transporter [Dictyobacter sp.]|nr:DMT family transporter [Dictyobacter sp.]